MAKLVTKRKIAKIYFYLTSLTNFVRYVQDCFEVIDFDSFFGIYGLVEKRSARNKIHDALDTLKMIHAILKA